MALFSGGRFNIWNAVKKQYEVVHPETEVARITDFADGIVQKLALTSAMTAVTALQSDSWFGKLLKMALTASGVKYSIAQNGYVCLGELFGGLIIQWGKQGAGNNWIIPYSISYEKETYYTAATDYAASSSSKQFTAISEAESSLTGFKLITSDNTDIGIAWISIGI